MSAPTRTAIAAALAGIVAVAGCREAPQAEPPSRALGEAALVSGEAHELRADVQHVLCASHIAPAESLHVRLLGTIGPNGAYSLQEMRISRHADRIVVDPRVRRAEGGMYIQMLIPLDSTLVLALEPGTHTLEVLGTPEPFTTQVSVGTDVDRAAPQTTIEPAAAGAGADAPMWLQGTTTDGYIAAIEWRVDGAAWQRAEEVEPNGPTLRCMARVPHARSGAQLEARAIDGQGVPDPTPATSLLP